MSIQRSLPKILSSHLFLCISQLRGRTVVFSAQEMAGSNDAEPDFSQPWKVSDIVLLVEDTRLHVHSGVLAMWSPVLENMFAELRRKNTRVLTLENQKADEIRQLLLFIYPTIQRPITEETCYSLLELAKQFEMSKVTEKCEEYMLKTLNSSSEVVDLLVLASKYKMRSLRDECLRMAKQMSWKVIQQHHQYEQIDLKEYREIAEHKIHSLQQELDGEKHKMSHLEEDAKAFRRHKEVSNASSAITVNAGLASPMFPRRQIVQPRPQKSRPVHVVFNSKMKIPEKKENDLKDPPPVPKRSYFPIKPIIKEF